MKKRYIIAIVVVALVAIGGVSFRLLEQDETFEKTEERVQEQEQKRDSNQDSKQDLNQDPGQDPDQDKEVEELSETEKHIMDLVNNKIEILEYFDRDNLIEFKITDIWGEGYYESSSNLRYLSVRYEFKCKDGTENCNHVNKLPATDAVSSNGFFVKIDLNNKDYIEKLDELSIPFNSDWKATSFSEIPEYKK